MTTTTDQFNKNRQYKDKNLLFDDISPIGKCIERCENCQDYFDKLNAYAICECCHENPSTYQDIEPIILAIQREKYFYKSREQNRIFRYPKYSVFDIAEEIVSKVSTRCQN